jgi:hypothetical protein
MAPPARQIGVRIDQYDTAIANPGSAICSTAFESAAMPTR